MVLARVFSEATLNYVLRYYQPYKFLISCFLCIVILNYHLYQEISFTNFFFSRIIEQNEFLICSKREHYCRLFRKVYFCTRPLTFIQISKSVLIIGTMHIYACDNNYGKCVNSKCLRVIMLLYASACILEFSKKRNII